MFEASPLLSPSSLAYRKSEGASVSVFKESTVSFF